MKDKNLRIPMNIQFFAESNPEGKADGAGEKELSLEEKYQELLAQNSQLMADNSKLKRDKDSASSDAANWKKKYNATLTDAQQAAQEKAEKEAERQEKYEALLKENTVNKLAKNFLKLGYSEEKAEEAANAQYDGDTDALFRIQSSVQADLIKKAEADWLKSRPPVSTGAGDGDKEDPFLAGFNS